MKIFYTALGTPFSFSFPTGTAVILLFKKKFFFCPECRSDSSNETMISFKQIIALFFFWFVPQCLAECSRSPVLVTLDACIWVSFWHFFTLRFSSIFLSFKDTLHLSENSEDHFLSFSVFSLLSAEENSDYTKFYIPFGYSVALHFSHFLSTSMILSPCVSVHLLVGLGKYCCFRSP